MIEISLSILNQCYTRRMGWYPNVNKPEQLPQRIAGIADILDQFDLIMLDSYGVLCRGPVAIDGAIEAIAMMRSQNKAFCVVSNDTMTNQSVAAEKYGKRGFDFTNEEVVTSLDMTEEWLKTVKNSESWAVIAPLPHPSDKLLEGMTRLNDTNGVIPEHVENILFMVGTGWTAEMQDNLVSSGQGRQFNMVVGNPDMGAPYMIDGKIHIGATPGFFIDGFVERTGQTGTPTLYGKPGSTIFQTVANRYGITDTSRVLMVGDTLYTDILGGNAMGFKTLLLECGIYQGRDVMEEIAKAGISPDFIAPHL
ncbi:HAD hydrolase-like protein [Sansalvadorimonas sp. 2012CJ34-2]|uniref:HAD hydrolase-like protein n=1 Tax=Parendozoicomonas callyspongiae TaxID=2942213 RepID=A0ABT0PGC9_9GAMM|nr:HAD hydrolase-like protein [Sansalvadorimonas sp. 2012CJ34-2]MCL6270398.1 HAD hydrolase-like protein [Sansalvadorimonas sp. 2012CJ34-2]